MNLTWKIFLMLLAGAAATGVSSTAVPQTPGAVDGGLDPLDVLQTGVRHNVWIVLDSSESMSRDFAGNQPGSPAFNADQEKLAVATDALRRLIASVAVDTSGQPLVNWGYVRASRCDGLNGSVLSHPPACGDADTASDMLEVLGPARAGGSTSSGAALDRLSRRIVARGHVGNLRAEQKHFMLLLTGGEDTCESGSVLGDGAHSGRLRIRDGTPALVQDVRDGSGNLIPQRVRAYNAGLKARLAYERLNPGVLDRVAGARGSVHVIGVGLDASVKEWVNHLSWEASGASHGNPGARSALFADSPDELMERLRDVVSMITTPRSEVTLGGPVVASVKELIPLANPSVSPQDILAGGAAPASGGTGDPRFVRGRYRNNVLLTTSVETPGLKGHLKAFNVYKVLDSGLAGEERQGDFTLVWDAGEELRARHPDDRTILFNLRDDPPGSPLHELRLDGELSRAELADLLGVDRGYLGHIDGSGARTKEDAAEIVVRVIRGYRLAVDPLTDTFYRIDGALNFVTTDRLGRPTWKLRDSTNAGPTVVGSPPRPADFDPPQWHGPEYGVGGSLAPGRGPSGFYWEHLNRQTVVYLGTNGGMMHAFRADNGAELFAYIPDDILGGGASYAGETRGSRATLKDLVALIVAEMNGVLNHPFFIAASATAQDVFLRASAGGDDRWHTILAFGRGKGGKFLTVLDVSDIGDWDRNTGNTRRLTDRRRYPRLLFNRGNRSGGLDPTYGDLGQTWSTPAIGNVRSPGGRDQWVLFAGSGYGAGGTMEGQFLHVLRLEDGAPLPGLLGGKIGPIENDRAALIEHNALVAAPTLYNPHEHGASSGQDYVTRVYIGDLQGSIYKLDCSDPDPANWTFRTFYELGGDQPITAPVTLHKDRFTPRIFLFVGSGGDHRVSSEKRRFLLVGLVDDDLDGTNTPGRPIRDPLGGELLIDLPRGSRVFAAPTVAQTVDGGGAVFFVSSRRVLDPVECAVSYHSTLFAFEAETGLGLFDLDPETEGEQVFVDLGEGKIAGVYHRDEHLYVSKSGGQSKPAETEVRGTDTFPLPTTTAGSVRLVISEFRLSPF